MSAHILVVDDEPHILEVLSVILTRAGYEVRTASSGEAALSLFDAQVPDVSLLDIRMPDMSGIELLSKIKERDPGAIVMVMTAYSTWEVAVEAMRLGALDYLEKGFSIEELRLKVTKALEQSHLVKENLRLSAENEYLKTSISEPFALDKIVGQTDIMRNLLEDVYTAAQSSSTVQDTVSFKQTGGNSHPVSSIPPSTRFPSHGTIS